MIIDSFTATLKGTYHARMDYPEDEEREEPGDTPGNSDETLVEKWG
jgi:hypothetical protein